MPRPQGLLVDRRFREVAKSSMMETIIGIRLDEIKTRLVSTNMRIGAITSACGFKSENYTKICAGSSQAVGWRNWDAGLFPEEIV